MFVDTCNPNTDDDKLVNAIFTSTLLIDVDKLLPIFNSNSSFSLILKLFASYLKSNNLVVESSDNTQLFLILYNQMFYIILFLHLLVMCYYI